MISSVVRIEGGQKIRVLAIALRHMGTDRTIVNEMAKRIRKAAGPLRNAVKKSARDRLPKRGGLNKWVSNASIRTQVLRSSRTAGVRLIVGKNSMHGRTDMVAIDNGVVRHPLWGQRKHWYPQTVTPGFATDVMHGDAADEFHALALESVDVAIEQVLHVIG